MHEYSAILQAFLVVAIDSDLIGLIILVSACH